MPSRSKRKSNSRFLGAISTFVPRRPEKLINWLDGLPTVVAPYLLVPHPLNRSTQLGRADSQALNDVAVDD